MPIIYYKLKRIRKKIVIFLSYIYYHLLNANLRKGVGKGSSSDAGGEISSYLFILLYCNFVNVG